jgi:hypothetical protein
LFVRMLLFVRADEMLVLVSFNVHLRAAKLPPMFHFVAALRPRNR